MMRINVLLFVMCALAACKSADGKPARAPEPAEATIASVRAEACACTDEACADRTMAALEAQRREFEAAYAEATSCVHKIKPPADPGDEVLTKMGEFKDQVCACADAACVERAEKNLMEWAMKNMEQLKDIKPSPAQQERADQIQAEMTACKERITPPSP